MQSVSLGLLLSHIFLAAGFVGLFLLFFFKVFDYLVDYLFELCLGHFRQAQERILQVHILRVHGKLVEHVGAAFEQRIVGVGLREQGHGFGETWLGLLIVAAGIIDFAERDLRYSLVDARPRGFLRGKDIVFNGMRGVASRQVEVADGVIHLVEIVLVAVVAGHAAQGIYFFLNVGA